MNSIFLFTIYFGSCVGSVVVMEFCFDCFFIPFLQPNPAQSDWFEEIDRKINEYICQCLSKIWREDFVQYQTKCFEFWSKSQAEWVFKFVKCLIPLGQNQ